MFGGNFAPRGWAFCNGQLLPISQNSALFSILGTTYGGDGRTTFALPELRGRFAMHAGTGPGLTPRSLGHKSGTETNTLNITQLPNHTHPINMNVSGMIGSNTEPATTNEASGNTLGAGADIYNELPPEAGEDLGAFSLNPPTIGNAGGNQPINNMPPYLVVNYIIALQGIFPSRS